MKTRKIGSLDVSVIGLGGNNFGRKLDVIESERVIHAALDDGINFFDTADVYGETRSEEYLGRALAGRRDEAVIATKFGLPVAGQGRGGSAAYVQLAADASLRRLGTDHIDLYLLHRPDPEVPIEETLGALEELVRAGKVREVGVSNVTTEELSGAIATTGPSRARIAAVQNNYSLLHREPEGAVLDEVERSGLAFIPYSPLARGLLSGKYRAGQPAPEGSRLASSSDLLTDARLDMVERLTAFAESQQRTLLELAVSWLLAVPVVASVIAGATSPEQVRANSRSGDWQLTPDELVQLNDLLS